MRAAMGRASAVCFCVAAGLSLGACASKNGGAAFGNLLAFNSLGAPPRSAYKPEIRVDCPEAAISQNHSTIRAYVGANQSNDNVRYQFDIGRLARQCSVANGQILIKVGVSGRVVLGPAGAPGVYSVPIRIAVERASDNSVVTSQIYRQPVSINPGADGVSPFTLVSQPLAVPYTRRQADEDYTIDVGFDPGGVHAPTKSRPRRVR